MFRYNTDGCLEWAQGADHLGDVYNTWNIDTDTVPELNLISSWINGNEIASVSLSPSELPTPHYTGPVSAKSDDCSYQSSLSDLDLAARTMSSTKKARRQAQNRQAQRAYRARKEKELDRCKSKVAELEEELERTQKFLATSTGAVLQDRIIILERENMDLQREGDELRGQLRRVAEVMINSASNSMPIEMVK